MKNRTVFLVMSALFAILTGIGAQIRIPFPVVPLTLQTFLVILSGLILGPVGGAVSQLAYLAMGLLGLPVFTGGGGIHYIFHPTFGFLTGFVPGAWIAGIMAQKIRSGNIWAYFPACIAATAVIYICGLSVLYFNLNFVAGKTISVVSIIRMGMLPFIPGDLFKIFAAAFVSAKVVPVLYHAGLFSFSDSQQNP